MNRVSKLVKTGTTYERIIYIDGVFEYHILENGSTFEKNHIHVMDSQSRIAMIRVGMAFPDDIANAVTYNLEDQVSSSVARLNLSGTIIDKEEYYPFGDSSLRTFSKKRYRFSGKEKDAESGLYYYGARYYAAWTCRFISLDPLMAKYPGMSPYVGFNNNPIRIIDPSGLEGEDWVKKPGSNTWNWDDNAKVQGTGNHETLADGTEIASAGYTYKSEKGMVTLGNNKDSWIVTPFPIEGKIHDLTQNSQGWEANLTVEQTKGMEIIPTTVIASSSADMWAINAWRFEQFNKGLDNLFLGMVAAAATPFIIGGAVVYGGGALSYTYSGLKFAATSYHYTFGVNGGYVSMASNVINQTSTQLSEKGNVRLGDFDLIALGSSGFITNQTSLVGQMVQGPSGTYLSYSVNGGFDGALVNKKLSKSYIFTSTLNGMLNPLMNKAPIVQPIGNEVINGWIQGVLNKAEKSKKLK